MIKYHIINRIGIFKDGKGYKIILIERGRIYNFCVIDDAEINVNGCVLFNKGKKSLDNVIILDDFSLLHFLLLFSSPSFLYLRNFLLWTYTTISTIFSKSKLMRKSK